MFSIYAEGVIPSHKRETRVSVHSVVDFRSATDLTGMDSAGLADLLNPGGGGRTGSGVRGTTGGQDAAEADAALNAVATNPAGQLVYWRVQ